MYYLLDDDKEVVPTDLMNWARAFGERRGMDKWRVGGTVLPDGGWVSTVFLGLDYHWGNGPPALFETMVFDVGGKSWEYLERCSTWGEALKQHEEAVDFALLMGDA